MRIHLAKIVQDDQGQALIEYAFILALVSITALALTPIGDYVLALLSAAAAGFTP